MLNKVILMGRLCADPEYRQTPNGVAMCRIRVAIDRGYVSKSTGERQADFINVTCWRQTAEFVSKYFHKGSMIIVEGSLQNNDYTDQNGVKHYSMIVSAENVSFCESKSTSLATQGVPNTTHNVPQNTQPYQTQNYTPNNQNAYVGQITAYQGYTQTRDTYANQQSLNGYPENCLPKPDLGDLSDFEEILSDGNPPF